MPNLSIGEYDMVLALSESKINYEIKRLLNRGVIKSKWQFLTSSGGENILNESHSNFEQAKKNWLGKSDKPDDQADALKKYALLMDATIDPPRMELVKDNYQEVLFKLFIKSGNIYYLEGAAIKKCDLAGKAYGFRVPVAQIRIDSEKMYFAGEDAIEQLREEGLSNHDFTVDSILLNFERANIAQYSPDESILPKEDKERAALQTAISNYFKALGKDKQNPYVLGYALKKKDLSERDASMLYATGSSFSTSISHVERASAFNFLMLTDHHPFPKSKYAGRMERSLLESAIDTSATINGVIAIDYPAFEQAYLSNLHNSIVDNFEKAFRSNGDLSDFYRSCQLTAPGVTVFRFERHNMFMYVTLIRRYVAEKGGIMVVYDIYVGGSVHAEIERKVFHFIDAGTVGVDQGFSTGGIYPIEGKIGRPGELTITLRASNEGKLNIRSRYMPPTVGRDTEKPQTRNDLDAIWMVLSNFISPFGLIGGLAAFLTDKAGDSIVNFRDQVFDGIEFASLEEFSNKVILPGSNIYTFKNIRLNGDPERGDCSVLFDIAYAIATD
ncbi:MAG: hypothetical protein ACXVJB_02510 [Mucilaginibacter sp.]